VLRQQLTAALRIFLFVRRSIDTATSINQPYPIRMIAYRPTGLAYVVGATIATEPIQGIFFFAFRAVIVHGFLLPSFAGIFLVCRKAI